MRLNMKTAAMAATLCAAAAAAPGAANAALRPVYSFAGIAHGAAADDPAVSPRVTFVQCANPGKRSARIRVVLFRKDGTPAAAEAAVAPAGTFMAATEPDFVGNAAVIAIGDVDAGFGLIQASSPTIVCSVQVFEEDAEYSYALPMNTVAAKAKKKRPK